ncbi:unnamed protein product [Linum tenue]|uniref:Uncharacterized protein n=1 Tax=Linum tenue TaxID=586396 RepID=A0AAV0IY78_9ROSI|nr:unnamed protein product [Linum tenue]
MAKNSADPKDAEKEYEAQVYRNFTGVCVMELFRVKGQKEAIQESPNRWRMIMCNGWATSLYASEGDCTSDFSVFEVGIDLGHEHMQDVVGLLFKYTMLDLAAVWCMQMDIR